MINVKMTRDEAAQNLLKSAGYTKYHQGPRSDGPVFLADFAKQGCACSGTNLDRFIQPCILSVLSDAALTSYEITKGLSKYAMFKEAPPDITGIYRYIKRMEQNNLLRKTSYFDKAQNERNLYIITPRGTSCLKNWIKTLEAYKDSIDELIKML